MYVAAFFFLAGLVGCRGSTGQSGADGERLVPADVNTPSHDTAADADGVPSFDIAYDCGPGCVDVPDASGAGETFAPGDAVELLGDLADQSDGIEEPPCNCFSSPELGIRIMSHKVFGNQSLGQSVKLAGVVAGNPDHMYLETSEGEKGSVDGVPYWSTSNVTIKLKEGDNWITVTAQGDGQVAQDSIMFTYNPAFLFGPLRVAPRAVFPDFQGSFVVTADMSFYGNFNSETLRMCRCTKEGQCVGDFVEVKDDGNLSASGDWLATDRLFSAKVQADSLEGGKLCFRLHADVKAGYVEYTALSPVACVDVVERIEQSTCEAVKTLQEEADELYWSSVDTSGAAAARQAVIGLLKADEMVVAAGESHEGYGVWVHYDNGLLGAFDFSPSGIRAGSGDETTGPSRGPSGRYGYEVGSKEVMLLSPAHDELGELDESMAVFQTLVASKCPSYDVDTVFANEGASLQQFRRMNEHGLIVVTGHGDSYFRELPKDVKDAFGWTYPYSQELLWTGEPVDCSKMAQNSPACTGDVCPAGSECVMTELTDSGGTGVCVDFKQVDLRTGRAVFGTKTYGILPSFVGHYAGTDYPDSLIYLGTCRSMWNGTLAMEFVAGRADTVVGYSGYVGSAFAHETGSGYFSSLVDKLNLSGEAMPYPLPEDPDNPGTTLRLLGNTELDIGQSEIVNPSWESGDLGGWQATGDVSVCSYFCWSVAVDAKYMLLMSTGVGFAQAPAETSQTFCVDEDDISMEFYWKLYSTEFEQNCGSGSQTALEAGLESGDMTVSCAAAAVDDLCPPGSCADCGSQYKELEPYGCFIGQDELWANQWRKAECDVSAFAGKGPVTLRISLTDNGILPGHSLVLVDNVKFK